MKFIIASLLVCATTAKRLIHSDIPPHPGRERAVIAEIVANAERAAIAELAHAERVAHAQRLPHAERLAHDERLAHTERLAHAERVAHVERLRQAERLSHSNRGPAAFSEGSKHTGRITHTPKPSPAPQKPKFNRHTHTDRPLHTEQPIHHDDSANQEKFLHSERPSGHSALKPVAILNSHQIPADELGSHSASFDAENGISFEFSGSEGVNGGANMIGSYSYPMEDGTMATFNFVADENGYQPQSDLLPVAPAFPHPIPQFVLDQIEFARQQDERSILEEHKN